MDSHSAPFSSHQEYRHEVAVCLVLRDCIIGNAAWVRFYDVVFGNKNPQVAEQGVSLLLLLNDLKCDFKKMQSGDLDLNCYR